MLFPDYRREYRRRHGIGGEIGGEVDPFSLTGAALLEHVNLTAHAVQRFQERCAGHPDPEIAARELLGVLAPDVRAVTRPPAWCRTGRADFYLVAYNEFCLPGSRNGSNGKAFDVLTCMHRASGLFALHADSLAGRCTFDPTAFEAADARREVVAAAFGGGARLSWQRPPWTRAEPRARFWIVFTDRLAAPVAWEPDRHGQPLVILDLAERRTLLQRLTSWLRPPHNRTGRPDGRTA